jgi:transcription elongation factor Elf1
MDARAKLSCPLCGGELTEPTSGDVHCYVQCRSCGEQFEMDDPRLGPR